MSADAWRECPNCRKPNSKKLADAYGKVSQDEYLSMFDKLGISDERTTLREDYEISTDEGGEFYIAYSCYCEVCKFAFTYKYREQIA
jgi:hypothetical protein